MLSLGLSYCGGTKSKGLWLGSSHRYSCRYFSAADGPGWMNIPDNEWACVCLSKSLWDHGVIDLCRVLEAVNIQQLLFTFFFFFKCMCDLYRNINLSESAYKYYSQPYIKGSVSTWNAVRFLLVAVTAMYTHASKPLANWCGFSITFSHPLK